MANRHNHYEAAFADLLRRQRVPYVAVNEAHRSWDAGGSLKSADFLVSPPGRESWIVDIKGRRFPSGTRQKQYWRNWTTRDDVRSLAEWARLLGEGIEPLLVFAYDVVGELSPVPAAELHSYDTKRYAFVAVRLADYLSAARPLSSRWDTIAMPVGAFRQQAIGWHQLLEQQATMAAASFG